MADWDMETDERVIDAWNRGWHAGYEQAKRDALAILDEWIKRER